MHIYFQFLLVFELKELQKQNKVLPDLLVFLLLFKGRLRTVRDSHYLQIVDHSMDNMRQLNLVAYICNLVPILHCLEYVYDYYHVCPEGILSRHSVYRASTPVTFSRQINRNYKAPFSVVRPRETGVSWLEHPPPTVFTAVICSFACSQTPSLIAASRSFVPKPVCFSIQLASPNCYHFYFFIFETGAFHCLVLYFTLRS